MKGAYDVLVSMGVITYFIPYLCFFKMMFKLQNQPAAPNVIRVPGGKPVATAGRHRRLHHDFPHHRHLSELPPPEEPNKPLAVIKVVGLCGLLVMIGVKKKKKKKKKTEKSRSLALTSSRYWHKNRTTACRRFPHAKPR